MASQPGFFKKRLYPGIYDALLSVGHLVNTDASLNNQSITQRDFERRRYSVPGVTKQVLRMVFVKRKNSLWHIYIFSSAPRSSLRTEKPDTRNETRSKIAAAKPQRTDPMFIPCRTRARTTHHGAYLDPVPRRGCLWCRLQIRICLSPSSGPGGTGRRILRAAPRQNIRASV